MPEGSKQDAREEQPHIFAIPLQAMIPMMAPAAFEMGLERIIEAHGAIREILEKLIRLHDIGHGEHSPLSREVLLELMNLNLDWVVRFQQIMTEALPEEERDETVRQMDAQIFDSIAAYRQEIAKVKTAEDLYREMRRGG